MKHTRIVVTRYGGPEPLRVVEEECSEPKPVERLKPAWFRQDLTVLFDLLQQKKIEPLIAQRLPLAEAGQAHAMLGKGGVVGKIVLV
jgi:hypothetical protein